MADKGNEVSYPQASLGLAGTPEGLRRVDGGWAGNAARGCTSCNRDEGRSSASLVLDALLPVKGDSGDAQGEGVPVHLAIDYCPHCGRVYDVRFSYSS